MKDITNKLKSHTYPIFCSSEASALVPLYNRALKCSICGQSNEELCIGQCEGCSLKICLLCLREVRGGVLGVDLDGEMGMFEHVDWIWEKKKAWRAEVSKTYEVGGSKKE